MKSKGPLITLLVGLVVAVVLIGLSVNATTKDKDRQYTAATNAAPSAGAPSGASGSSEPAGPSSAAAPEASTAPPKAVNVTYAGAINGGPTTVAIAIRNGKAVAYLCDGRQVEAWLQGTAVDGKLFLTGRSNAKLVGTYGNGIAAGTVTAAGKTWTFRVTVVKAPSGLYRATAKVRNATVVGGWIKLPNGRLVGLVTDEDGNSKVAPGIDPSTGQANLNGTTVTPAPVDPTNGY